MFTIKFDKWFILLGAIIFVIPLILLWYGYTIFSPSQTNYSALLGVFPYSDAGGYYYGALKYLNSGVLHSWNLRRPIHTLLFSSELFLMGKNYYYAMLLHNCMCGISSAIAAYTITKTFNKLSGIAFFIVSFMLSLAFIPTTLTETTGVAIGMLAFTFLWIGYLSRQILTFLFGIFVLSLALHARAGAFLILPCLILLAMFDFTKTAKLRLKIFVFSCISVAIATFTIFLLQKLYGDGSNQIHANFATTLFGIISGGKGWLYAYKILPPSITNEAQQASFLYKKSLEIFLNNPFLTLLGFFKSLGGFIEYHLNFSMPNKHLKFIPGLYIAIKLISLSFYCLCLYILKQTYVNKYFRRIILFLTAGFIGIILSALIIWADGNMRVFAATYAFWALALSFIVFAYQHKKSIESFKLKIPNEAFSQIKLISSAIIGYYLVMTIIIPSFSAQSYKISNSLNFTNLDNNTVLVQNAAKSPYVIVDNSKRCFSKNKWRRINQAKYKQLVTASGIDEPVQKAFLNIIHENIPKPFVIFTTLNLLNYQQSYIISDPSILQNNAPFLKLNGKKSKDGYFFIVQVHDPSFDLFDTSQKRKEY